MIKLPFILLILLSLIVSGAPDDTLLSKHNLKTLKPVQKTLQSASVVITTKDRISIGYGSVVSSNGHIITKASLLENVPKILVRLDQKEYPATLLNKSEKWDVALLKIDITNAISLNFNTNPLKTGDIVISNGVTSLLTRRHKFGVISANSRPIPMQEARLDCIAHYQKEKGYVISELKPEGETEKAGLKKGDIIEAIDDKPIEDFTIAFHAHLYGKWPGESITLHILREDKPLEFTLELMWLHDIDSNPQDRNEAMSGRISTRRTGFPMIIQHDIPLSS